MRAFLRSALKTSGRLFPARGFRCGESARYFHQERPGDEPGRIADKEPRLLRKKQKLKPTHAGQSFPPERKRHKLKSVLQRCRDGAEKSYFVCHTTWGSGPATLLDFPPGESFGRRESRTSRRFAPGLAVKGNDNETTYAQSISRVPEELCRSEEKLRAVNIFRLRAAVLERKSSGQ